jgi:hypothetical protein
MRRALSVRHLKDDGDGFGLVIADFLVRGRIDWDDDSTETNLIPPPAAISGGEKAAQPQTTGQAAS